MWPSPLKALRCWWAVLTLLIQQKGYVTLVQHSKGCCFQGLRRNVKHWSRFLRQNEWLWGFQTPGLFIGYTATAIQCVHMCTWSLVVRSNYTGMWTFRFEFGRNWTTQQPNNFRLSQAALLVASGNQFHTGRKGRPCCRTRSCFRTRNIQMNHTDRKLWPVHGVLGQKSNSDEPLQVLVFYNSFGKKSSWKTMKDPSYATAHHSNAWKGNLCDLRRYSFTQQHC